jgi:hypothetical protein
VQIPDLEAQLIAAKAEKQREALARHHQIIANCVPKLIAAVEAAAAVQIEAIVLRNRAVAELGEQLVQAKIPAVGYLGLLIPDLVRQWATDLRRSFDPPGAPRAPANARASKANGQAKPAGAAGATIADVTAAATGTAAPVPAASTPPKHADPAPRPVRPLRHDPPPTEGQAAVVFLRHGIDLGDGSQSLIGDRCNMPIAQARTLVERGAADYPAKASG